MAWLVSGALLIAFASYVALPIGLASYLPLFAARYGLHLDVERVRVDPFRSGLEFSGVRMAAPGDSSIECSRVETRVDLAQLLSGRLVLDDFRLSGATLRAGGAGVEAAGVLAEAPAGLPGEVSVGELVIDGVELATVSEALGRPVAVEWLRLSSLDEVFRPEGTEVEADISIGKGRSRLRGRLNFDETGWILDAGVDANDVPLDGFPALLGAEGSWRGTLDGTGPVRLVYAPVDRAFSVATAGRWVADGLELGLARVALSGVRAEWDGAASMTFSGDGVDALSVDGEAGFRGFRADVADVLAIEAAELTLRIIELDGLILDGGSTVHAAGALADRTYFRTTEDFGVDVPGLRADAVERNDGTPAVERDAAPPGPGDTRSSFRVRIREASTADSGTVVRIVDRTTEPDFAARVDVTSATLRGFDPAAAGVPARFSVEAAADVFTVLRAGGVLVPTSTGADFDLDATIHGLSLRELSPYSRLHLGQPIEDGQADVTLQATIRASDLEGVADFTMRDVVLGKSELPAGSSGRRAENPSALGAALDSLEDEQGRIELKVPLRGRLDAPGFDFDALVALTLADTVLETAEALPKAE